MLDPLFDTFVIRALLGGIGVALLAGVIGCFIVWNKMAYFGDSLAHSSLLGVALGLLIGSNTNITVLVICIIFALFFVWVKQRFNLSSDTLLGILAHSGLAIGLVAISFVKEARLDLHSYLFGDILTITNSEVALIYIGAVSALTIIAFVWSSLTLMSINEDLAKAEGVNTTLMSIILMLLMVIVVVISIRIVGVLLITSLLIIPAATAKQFAKSPELMAIYSSILGVASVIIGIVGSVIFDTPTGPSIVVSETVIFLTTASISYIITLQFD
ncbi:MAG: iron chelate uptake ABC transporter family permease subunit [Nitrospinota bacterium]